MSFIKVIAEEEADGELKEVYQRTLARLSPSVRQRRGDKLPPIVRIFSLCPELLEARVGFDKGIYRPGHSGGKGDVVLPTGRMLTTYILNSS